MVYSVMFRTDHLRVKQILPSGLSRLFSTTYDSMTYGCLVEMC